MPLMLILPQVPVRINLEWRLLAPSRSSVIVMAILKAVSGGLRPGQLFNRPVAVSREVEHRPLRNLQLCDQSARVITYHQYSFFSPGGLVLKRLCSQ
jgi:hypothetical protein